MGCGASSTRHTPTFVDPPPERHTALDERGSADSQGEAKWVNGGTPSFSTIDAAAEAPDTQTTATSSVATCDRARASSKNTCAGIEVAVASMLEERLEPCPESVRKAPTHSLRHNSRTGSRPQSRGHSRPMTAESCGSEVSYAESVPEHGGEDESGAPSPRGDCGDSYVVVRDSYSERLVGRDSCPQTLSASGLGTPQPPLSAGSALRATSPADRPS